MPDKHAQPQDLRQATNRSTRRQRTKQPMELHRDLLPRARQGVHPLRHRTLHRRHSQPNPRTKHRAMAPRPQRRATNRTSSHRRPNSQNRRNPRHTRIPTRTHRRTTQKLLWQRSHHLPQPKICQAKTPHHLRKRQRHRQRHQPNPLKLRLYRPATPSSAPSQSSLNLAGTRLTGALSCANHHSDQGRPSLPGTMNANHVHRKATVH